MPIPRTTVWLTRSACRISLCALLAGWCLALSTPGFAATIAAVKSAPDGSLMTNITGTVTQVGGNSGRFQFALQDPTGGVIVDRGTLPGYTLPQLGDAVTVTTATKTTFGGVIQLQPSSVAALTITTPGPGLPTPLVLTGVSALRRGAVNPTQGLLVRVRGARLVSPLPSAAGTDTWLNASATGNGDYVIADDWGVTATLRFPNDLAGSEVVWRQKLRPALSISGPIDRTSTASTTLPQFDVVGVAVPGSDGALQLRLANAGSITTAPFDTSPQGPILEPSLRSYAPASGDFARSHPQQIRLVAFNTEKFLTDASNATADPAYRRLLPVLDPDIVGFAEVDPAISSTQIKARLDDLMPLGNGIGWQIQLGVSDGFNRCILAARWPLQQGISDTIPTAGLRGVTAARIDLPDSLYGLGRDFYAAMVHWKCCSGPSNTTQRQQQADALAKWLGDLRTTGGDVDLPTTGIPLIAMGDFNLVDPDPQGPEVTLRTGAIANTLTYGPGITGDWDDSPITDLTPLDPFTGDLHTWPSGTTNPTSRLDRLYYTDSVIAVAQSFVLNTRTLTPTQLAAAGLRTTDNEDAGDHLPIVADFSAPVVPVALSAFSLE
jgi:endonuclease/exonuclease/phosphatase family metal-dependent hydrolase